MKKIVLISCVSKKKKIKSLAKDLYISSLFKYNLRYAESLNPDAIFILSAKYGLVSLNEMIEPYDKTLNEMKLNEVKEWSGKILDELIKKSNLEEDMFIFLAGEKYRKFLVPKIKNFKVPLEKLGIGKQLKWLKEKTNE